MGPTRTRRTWRTVLGLAATATLALTVAACGDDDESAEPAATDSVDITTDTAPTETADDTSDTAATDTADDPSDTAATAATDEATPTDEGDAEAETTGGEPTVQVATHPDLGDLLVDAAGMTLYGFALDDGTTTACTGGCVDIWPPLVDADPAAGAGVDVAALGTAEGIEPDQVTYEGQLLYYYAGDSEPGDATGIEIPDWYAVAPDGSPIEAAAAQSSGGSGGPIDY